MEMTQEVWDRITALEERASRDDEEFAALKAELAAQKITAMQGQVKTALAAKDDAAPASAPPSMSALMRSLDRHGIRIHPEDLDEAQGSGSERWGQEETWAESHDGEGAPV
jgi:uncharacterized coiled-coil protein SlyX